MSKKPVPKNSGPKPIIKEKNDPNKKLMGILKNILYWIFTILIACVFYMLGLSKKDIEPINKGVDRIDKGVVQIDQNVTQLRQDILKNNDYKKYLEIYQELYKSIMEKSFPGGYTVLGLRDSTLINPVKFSNKNIQVDIGEGTMNFTGRNCLIEIDINTIHFLETQNSISNIGFGVNIQNYEIGTLYPANKMVTMAGWKQYVTILSDDVANPVFVYGFSKQ